MNNKEKIKLKQIKNQTQNKNEQYYKLLQNICSISVEEALKALEASLPGLNSDTADERLKKYGENYLLKARKISFFMDILIRFKNPLVIQLLLICIISGFMGDLRSVIVVGAMIFLSVFLAYFQERRSSNAAEKLQKMVQAYTTVLREGKEERIPMSYIVPGDIVILDAGSIIPADIRIIYAKDFFVSQSALTGESMPLEKYADFAVSSAKKEVLEYDNACFQGSNVISGSAKAVVVNTGLRTFLGSISITLNEPKESTGFDKGVNSFVWLMIRFMIVMVSVTFLIVGLTKHNWIEALLYGLSVAVGLTPEMLPMIMTVCLSKGAIVMSKKKVIVKKLKAIQNFGAMNILCTDKTGTLTQDNIILEKYVDVTNRESEDVLWYSYMNSYYQTGMRNLLDKAILAHEDLDVEKTCRKVDEIPFDFNRKRMSVIIEYENTHVLICKGAVEEVYNASDRYQVDEEIYPMIDMVQAIL